MYPRPANEIRVPGERRHLRANLLERASVDGAEDLVTRESRILARIPRDVDVSLKALGAHASHGLQSAPAARRVERDVVDKESVFSLVRSPLREDHSLCPGGMERTDRCRLQARHRHPDYLPFASRQVSRESRQSNCASEVPIDVPQGE